ncbi:MAG TPA: hypothetical protein VLC46_20265 [Thermoanaerobaculia bacterium]|jgi:hypothetical protein|nr:hypothetical protein [Thermoanaerobaculia bacterium]
MTNFSIAAETDILSLTRQPSAPVARGLFVGEDGNVVGAHVKALGISRYGDVTSADVALNRDVIIGVLGLFPLIVGTPFANGAEIASDANGKGITAVAGDYVNAIAMEQGVNTGDVVLVYRVSYKLAGTSSVLTGALTGTVTGVMVNVAATAGGTAGGSTPNAAQVDAGIAAALAPLVASTNLALKELQAKVNAIINGLP